MSFLTPLFLYGVALVGIPLLIHLIRRRKLKVIRWAAMEFLQQSQRKQKRRLRIEELILLALRMLIVALAALAFARPVLRALGVSLLDQNANVYAVIVLDNSFSMNANDSNGKRSFARAQETANNLLTNILKNGDAVSLVLLSDKPDDVVKAPSYDRSIVKQRVLAAQVSDRTTDYYATAQEVDRLLKASSKPNKEVYWITDDQADAWKTSQKEAARPVWTSLGKQARMTWVSVGPAPADRENLAVETPVLGSELVTPQLATRIEARITNFGSKQRNDVLVNLMVDGRPSGATRISIPPNGVETARFVYRFVQPGTHAGSVTLADAAHIDGLEIDNSAPFVVRVRDRIKALVQDMHPTANPSKSESYYLLTAMAPGGAAESLLPKLREGTGLGGMTLRDYDAIVIAGLTDLSSNDRNALAEYVKAGGGVLLFPGPDTDIRRVNKDLEESNLLPARLGARKTLEEKDALTLNPASITHPAMALFKDTSTLNIASALFLTYHPLEPLNDSANPNAVRVMARFSNGDPAFVEKQIGLGHVVLAASSAGAVWNQMPLKPSYVPLVYQLMSYLGQGATSHRNLRQDEPLFLSLPLGDANKSVRVTSPNGRTTAQNSSLDARGVTFTYGSTQSTGVYKVSVAGSNTSDAFAVGLPVGESNLASTDPAPASRIAGLPENSLTVANDPTHIQTAVNRARHGTEIWRPLVWLVIALLFVEIMLAQMFGRRG